MPKTQREITKHHTNMTPAQCAIIAATQEKDQQPPEEALCKNGYCDSDSCINYYNDYLGDNYYDSEGYCDNYSNYSDDDIFGTVAINYDEPSNLHYTERNGHLVEYSEKSTHYQAEPQSQKKSIKDALKKPFDTLKNKFTYMYAYKNTKSK